ncbi:MAG: glucosaminidase domain-containing protein, partial [Bryobacterales bacterium]|nr:glucosaminidase domain-containing protein [Bryobacterales bacterium]
PYGQEKPGATMNDREKFATYLRDSETGLDYADQRYHQPGWGRFLTPDPYQASGGPASPGSWNRYAYVEGDPVNRVDPKGLFWEGPNLMALDGGFMSADTWGGGGYRVWTMYLTDNDTETSFTESFASPLGQGGGGGGSQAPPPVNPDCDESDPTNAKVIGFLRRNTAAAEQLAEETGLSREFILAWAAFESGYGEGTASRRNSNFFGLTAPNGGTGGWSGAIACHENAHSGFACFDSGHLNSLLVSGRAALLSQSNRYLTPSLTAQNSGGSIADIASAVARGGVQQ